MPTAPTSTCAWPRARSSPTCASSSARGGCGSTTGKSGRSATAADLLTGRGAAAHLQPIDEVGGVLPDVAARLQHQLGEGAVGEVEVAVGAERQPLWPAQARVDEQGL